jgi:hypothetical protein
MRPASAITFATAASTDASDDTSSSTVRRSVPASRARAVISSATGALWPRVSRIEA